MQIKLSFSYIITFLLLLVVMLEIHETVHIIVGRIICGCWGTRDFNAWELCDDCDKTHSLSWLATLAGPIFSFAMMWLGRSWLFSTNVKKQTLGFAFIFTNIPFGRITQTMKGAGDEMVVIRHLLKNDLSPNQLILIGSAIVLILGVPPIIKAYRIITNKRSWLYLLGFLTLPIAFILIYILIGMNSLLNIGFLSNVGIMGTPLLITLHTLMALILLVLLQWKNFKSI